MYLNKLRPILYTLSLLRQRLPLNEHLASRLLNERVNTTGDDMLTITTFAILMSTLMAGIFYACQDEIDDTRIM